MKEKVKQAWNSRLGFGVIMFIIGAFCLYFIMPTKTIVEIKTVTVEKIVEKIVVQWKIQVVEKLVEVRKTTHTVITPDKTVIDEIYESNESQVSRMEEQFKETLKEYEKSLIEEYKKTVINPKFLNVFVGAKTALNHLDRPNYLVGFSYDVVGPITIGGIVSNAPDIAVTVGLRF